MSRKQDRSFYVRATCKTNKDGYWICRSKKPDIESTEEVELQLAINSYHTELVRVMTIEHQITGEITLVERCNKAKDGEVKSDENPVVLEVNYEDFSVSLVYRIGSPVNRSLSEYEQGEVTV